MLDKDTVLRAVRFDHPTTIPVIFHINMACWDSYDRTWLASLVDAHPSLFPHGVPLFVRSGDPTPYPEWCRANGRWTDPWGCVWETRTGGFIGTVVQHPIKDLSEIAAYRPPDPEHTTHWYPVTWKKGVSPTGGSIGFFDFLRSGEIGHGHTFLKLIDILGYEKALYAMQDEEPPLAVLLDMIGKFNLGLVQRFISYADVEWLGYAEDLGMQVGPMLSPAMFRKWILPVYRRIMEPAEQHGCVIHMHSDGDIRALADDLLTLPVDVFNIQDTANTIGWLARHMKGKVAIDLDIDRMHITQKEEPRAVRAYLTHVMRTMYDRAGGLILTYGLYPGTPQANIETMMDFLEDVATGGKMWTN